MLLVWQLPAALLPQLLLWVWVAVLRLLLQLQCLLQLAWCLPLRA